jgi:hypothetical protein
VTATRTGLVSGVLLAAGLAAGCRGGPPSPAPTPLPVRVTDVRLGRTVGLDKRVPVENVDFGPQDTVFISVVTEGQAPRVTLSARWLGPSGALLEEMDQAIAPAGTAVSEFHLWQPSGFAPGPYQVEIEMEGARVAARSFTVQ